MPSSGEWGRGDLGGGGPQSQFVAMTNGDVGHSRAPGGRWRSGGGGSGRVAKFSDRDRRAGHPRRRAGAVAREPPDLARRIRDWQADIVMGHRPYDYHPDHRYTGVLMDYAAMVVVAPFFVPDTTPTPRNPVFMNYSDGFQDPKPFTPTCCWDPCRPTRSGSASRPCPHSSATKTRGRADAADVPQRRPRARRLPPRHREEAQRRGCGSSIESGWMETYGEKRQEIQYAEAFELGSTAGRAD